LFQLSRCCGVCRLGRGLVAVGAGVGEQGGEGGGGGVGDGGPDGGLVGAFAVEALNVHGGQQLLFERVGGFGQDAGQVGQLVQQRRIVGGRLVV
jgi:hypothetical protein